MDLIFEKKWHAIFRIFKVAPSRQSTFIPKPEWFPDILAITFHHHPLGKVDQPGHRWMVVIYKMLPIGSSTAEIPQPPIAKNRRVSFFGWPILRGYVSFRECNYPYQKITTLRRTRTIQHNRLFLSKKMERLFFWKGMNPTTFRKRQKTSQKCTKGWQFQIGLLIQPFFSAACFVNVF